MQFKVPKKSYLWPSGALLATWAGWLVEQQLSLAYWWSELPFGYISGLLIAFWLGLIIQDLYNPKSWIRHNLRELSSVQFGDVQREAVVLNFGKDFGDESRTYIKLTLPIVFRRKASAIDIRVTAYHHQDPLGSPQKKYTKHQWCSCENKKFNFGDKEEVPIALIGADSAHLGFYGDAAVKELWITDSSHHLIVVDVFFQRRTRSHKIYLKIHSRQMSHSPNGHIYSGGRFSVDTKTDNIFDSEWIKTIGE